MNRMIRLAVSLFLLVMAAVPAVVAQDGSDQPPPAPASHEEPTPTKPPQEWPQPFRPSQEISADAQVSFPTDM